MGDGFECEVAIAGGGPTGLMLAGELALAGVDAAVLEARPGPELVGSRAGGLHIRTMEILDQRGIAERFVAAGTKHPAVMFADGAIPVGELPTRFPFTLGLFQREIEALQREWVVDELGARVHYGREAIGFEETGGGVEVRLAGGGSVRAAYLVGCDGGRSAVRKAAGIDFPGWDASRSALIAEVEMSGEPELGIRHAEWGISGIGPIDPDAPDGPMRLVVTEREPRRGDEPTRDDLRRALRDVYGTDFGLAEPTWLSRFTDATRQAAAYRVGRVLLAGDAAHIHYPAGGQGLQQGVQDVVNLGWKLAQVVRGEAPDALLDTYDAERRPPTARALRDTMAAGALHRGDPRTAALREQLTELAALPEAGRRLAAERVGLDIRYDLGGGGGAPDEGGAPAERPELLGRRMPDLDLATAAGPRRVYSLLHRARPALINLGEPGALDAVAAPWAERVPLLDATNAGEWELPIAGVVPAPSAVLVRPDGHVAWVGTGSAAGLADALATWFGPPAR
jgi:3-(3-hydroxy-phenyl)propionate hydroxylase